MNKELSLQDHLTTIRDSKNPVELVTITPGAEEIMLFCARVSNPSNQLKLDSKGLLKYCIEHKHWSIFEQATATFQIRTSRAIAAQILRHRSFTFQEYSQRYAVANSQVVYPARRQDTKNKQNSIDDMSDEDKQWFLDAQEKVWQTSNSLYQEALAKGIAKEQARFLLPLGTETTLFMSGNIRNWIHYADLRSSNGTQKEHADLAIAIKEELKKQLPSVAAALGW